MAEDFLFSGEEVEEVTQPTIGTWKVLIVDDEPEVHAVTKLALSDFTFRDKSLDFLSAYSGTEATNLLKEHSDIAIVLLDVVMETDDAGLKVADFIRNELENDSIRIILRTGQPGQAPERQVIVNYDINDYKSKTELTAQKLFTVIMAGLRSYRDIMSLRTTQDGLKKIISASSDIFSVHSMEQFIDGVMMQLTSILGCGEEQAMYASNSLMVNCQPTDSDTELKVVAGQGRFGAVVGKRVSEISDIINDELQGAFAEAIKRRAIVYRGNYLIAYCHSKFSTNSLLFVSGIPTDLSNNKRDLVELFAQNVQVAYESIQLKIELEASQTELLQRLGGAIEKRLNDRGEHIYRVGQISAMLAELYGLSNSQIELLKRASGLHDTGKILLSDDILKAPKSLTEEQWQAVKQAPVEGYKILAGSERELIQIGAIVAQQHHEHWDGTGYPDGLSGTDIHIYARIVSIANVYDSLRSKLVYKDAWSHEKAIEYLFEQSGKKFDPKLIELFDRNQSKFSALY
ncbi:DUF3369 domain-containing protein [Psychrosphaera ytuae]|uniref:DUF3369 domain-containing protein n=1 Tax=Psychrosphaera ytuae TaxID=2820710 RepID=A0A975DC58_9GAMM|nr:response regulator [Psychrosphaera ytuae]QTH64447.1 DUF3369 domain-containing protein [Psychrosphaera ytuae]